MSLSSLSSSSCVRVGIGIVSIGFGVMVMVRLLLAFLLLVCWSFCYSCSSCTWMAKYPSWLHGSFRFLCFFRMIQVVMWHCVTKASNASAFWAERPGGLGVGGGPCGRVGQALLLLGQASNRHCYDKDSFSVWMGSQLNLLNLDGEWVKEGAKSFGSQLALDWEISSGEPKVSQW